MKLRRWLFFLAMLPTLQAHGADAPANQEAPAYRPPGWQPAPDNIPEWADRCTDFTVNSWGFKDPENTLKVMRLFSDPNIYLEFAQRSLDPTSYARIAGTMLDPAMAKNYLEWSDPVIYSKWTAAMMDPNFYARAMMPMLDPNTYMRWMFAPMDPRWWSVAMQTMNPGVWMKWLTAPLDPNVMAPLAKAVDPATGANWSQALSDPANYRWNVFPWPTYGANQAAPSPWFTPDALPPTGAGGKAAEPAPTP